MNQTPPIKRPPQPTPQRPQQRSPQRPPQDPNAKYGKIFFGILIGTVALLVVSLIVLCVALAVGGGESPSHEPSDQHQNDTPNDNAPAGNNHTSKNDGVKTNPSRDTYQIGNASSYQQISGITSYAAVLIDLDNFQAIAGKNADIGIVPASMTKVMTVLIACENLKSLKDTVTVTQEAVNFQAQHQASGYGLEAGEIVSIQDLLYLIYYRSDTVACLMMSEYIAGSESGFVKLMNEKVQSMGLTNTRFSNSTGLYFEGDDYYTTCKDMAAIMAYALENTLAKKILTSTGTYYLSTGSHKGDPIGPGWRVDGGRLGTASLDTVTVKGGKTGYETVSGSCLITYAVGGSGKQYIQVVVGGQGVQAKACSTDVKYIYKTYAG